MQEQEHSVISLSPHSAQLTVALANHFGFSAYLTPDYDEINRLIAEHDIVHLHYWNSPEIYDFLHSDHPEMRLLIKFNIGGEHAPHVITDDLVEFADFIQTTGPFAQLRPAIQNLDPDVRLAKTRMIYGAADFRRVENLELRPHTGFNVPYIGTVNFCKMHPEYVKMSSAVDIPDVRFDVCGSGDALTSLKAEAERLDSTHKFAFHSHVENITSVLEEADVFGYPLCEDNYSSGELILQEVAYAGIPSVVFPYGGVGHLVVDDFTGLIVHSAQEYKEALEYLYHNPEERARLGANAKEYARQLFGEENSARRTCEVYDRMLERPKRKRALREGQAVLQQEHLSEDWPEQGLGSIRFLSALGHKGELFEKALTTQDLPTLLDIEKQISQLSPVLAHGPGSVIGYSRHYEEDPHLLLWAGLIWYERGEHIMARHHFQETIKAGNTHWRVYWYLSLALNKRRDWDGALDSLSIVLEAAPDFEPASQLSKKLLSAKQQAAKLKVPPAPAEKQSAQELLSNMFGPLLHAATTEEIQEMGAILKPLIQEHPKAFEHYYHVGLKLHNTGHHDEAQVIYDEVMEHHALDSAVAAWAAFKNAEMLWELGDNEAGDALLQQSLTFNDTLLKPKIVSWPADKKLAVGFQGQPIPDGVLSIPMRPLDEQLWDYYFDRRQPDEVYLTVPVNGSESTIAMLAHHFMEKYTTGGILHVSFKIKKRQEVQTAYLEKLRQFGIKTAIIDE